MINLKWTHFRYKGKNPHIPRDASQIWWFNRDSESSLDGASFPAARGTLEFNRGPVPDYTSFITSVSFLLQEDIRKSSLPGFYVALILEHTKIFLCQQQVNKESIEIIFEIISVRV